MAKVPQYKSQTAPVKTAGQAMLNAFANPQTVSSGIRAAQQTLNTVQDIGMKIFEHELKQRLVERGLSADEIERVMAAGHGEQSEP